MHLQRCCEDSAVAWIRVREGPTGLKMATNYELQLQCRSIVPRTQLVQLTCPSTDHGKGHRNSQLAKAVAGCKANHVRCHVHPAGMHASSSQKLVQAARRRSSSPKLACTISWSCEDHRLTPRSGTPATTIKDVQTVTVLLLYLFVWMLFSIVCCVLGVGGRIIWYNMVL